MDQMNEVIHNVRWSCQFLSLLHRNGFPSIGICESAIEEYEGDITVGPEKLVEAARGLVNGTRHLSHPSLVALVASLEALPEHA